MSSARICTFDETDKEALYKWIDSYAITRAKKCINRDFSDAVPLVEMLKTHFPKSVEMHNYTPSNAFAQKLDNWRTLQRKVLHKQLKLSVPNHVLELLAKSEVGAIESVLWQIKQALDRVEIVERQREENVYTLEGFPADLSEDVTPIRIKQGGKVYDHRIVPANVYTDLIAEIRDKDDTIRRLNEKIFHLEELVALKDSRIEDLRCKQQSECNLKETKRFLNHLF